MPDALQDLTPAHGRWKSADKEKVVLAVQRRQVARDLVIATFGLSEAELIAWERRFQAYGRNGLKVTRIQTLPEPTR